MLYCAKGEREEMRPEQQPATAAAASSRERRKQRRRAARTQAVAPTPAGPESPAFLCDEDNYLPDDADLSQVASLSAAEPLASRRPPVTVPCGAVTPSLMLMNFQHFVHKLGIPELTRSTSPCAP